MIDDELEAAVRTSRLVCLAGLPGVGKSLLLGRAAHLASRLGRRVHVLRWDGARLAFDAKPYSDRYPEVDGVTHPAVRRAAGIWARQAIGDWWQATGTDDLLLAETPLLGNRFLELAIGADDDVEPLLRDSETRFVVIVPSARVRDAITGARQRDLERPRSLNDRKSAALELIEAQWTELTDAARELGVPGTGAERYDPDVYWGVYARILVSRRCHRLPIDALLDASPAASDLLANELLPTPQAVEAAYRVVERMPLDHVVDQVTRWSSRV